jgi:arylsulfatase A-like enzyme
MHEESIRTPMIVHDPRSGNAVRGKRVAHMTLNIDAAPTVMALAGVEPLPRMQGRDLGPLLGGQPGAWRSEWYYDQLFDSGGWLPPVEGVRNERWKYARYVGMQKPFEELYDLHADPGEQRNLAAEPGAQERLTAMRVRWDVWRRRIDDWTPARPWTDPP